MRQAILAARTETAIERIATETTRLGGTFARPLVKGDAEHRQVILLEAIASSLTAIHSPETTARPSGPVEVEPVEAIISVVAEEEEPKRSPRKAKATP